MEGSRLRATTSARHHRPIKWAALPTTTLTYQGTNMTHRTKALCLDRNFISGLMDLGVTDPRPKAQQEIVPDGCYWHINVRSDVLDIMDSTSSALGPDEINQDAQAHLASRQREWDLETWQEFSIRHEQPASKVAPNNETEPSSKAQQDRVSANSKGTSGESYPEAPLQRTPRRLPLP